MKYLIILLCFGFFITVHNDQAVKLNCYLYWENHPFKFNSPANVFGGEMDPHESIDLLMEYSAGKYLMFWMDRANPVWQQAFTFSTTSDTKRVTLKPYKVVIE